MPIFFAQQTFFYLENALNLIKKSVYIKGDSSPDVFPHVVRDLLF
jgi:hypothetical protein